MNKVIILGNLTREPEVKYTAAGKAVGAFTVAVNEGYGDKKTTTFIPVVVWEKTAENCGNCLVKGSKVLIEGRLTIRTYETKEGEKKKVAEVVAQNVTFLDKKQEAAGAEKFGKPIADDEVPF